MKKNISFDRNLEGKYTIIDSKDISEINKRIGEEMKPIIQEFERKQLESWLKSNKKIY